ncbi:NAD(P)/FAD-dependent oxidoreductase [Phytohabitans sp. ZYX-F-186]|uniref:NAD(P)/FAD-dependent oxidoreductase n=1 Tax=Phytohabitans maris TaxID=3071409 RepID=A0ABU0ZV66_9ACTN|nr:NAD(P)/FAD-dependent oxidoreductase [Phytohabitans sp. ZYX-F-186]MDQ7910838.1 NAD(P)/FAD-dependent oxidoreductase [Phytohabitans sp. ZYX-F-186]
MTENAVDHDVVIVGAGVCGLYALHLMLKQGLRVAVLERADGLGGTWYANRYPGCRFDSESYTYGYSFSEELLREWSWSELFAARPETLDYLNHVADRFELTKHIQFGSTVVAAAYDESRSAWTVRLDDGRSLSTRFLMTAIGHLSAPVMPRIPGLDSFQGRSFHTYHWPSEGVELTGQRVAVVGTGSTGVQIIAEIADKVDQLVVFQRNPNWCAPLHNRPIGSEEMERIKASYDEIFERCAQTPGGFLHGPDRRKVFELSEEERLAFWEELYAAPGFGIWLGNFRDTFMDEAANAELSAFIAGKIRQRVSDPAVADKLIPRDHGFGAKRVPLETRYYEAYNRPNVRLVDIKQTPIERVTPAGIRTGEAEYAFDLIVYATGFDGVTGPFDRIDITGVGGVKLADKWADGPRTLLGTQINGFPNLFTLVGPQSGSVATNFPRGIEEACEWVSGLVAFVRERGYQRVEATASAEQQWVDHVKEMAAKVLLSRTRSWFTGYNPNLDRSTENRYVMYTGGAVRYRQRLQEQAANGYPGFTMA